MSVNYFHIHNGPSALGFNQLPLPGAAYELSDAQQRAWDAVKQGNWTLWNVLAEHNEDIRQERIRLRKQAAKGQALCFDKWLPDA